MSIEEYISSGVLESYVMGELSDKEMQKVQCMALVHDDVHKELEQIELAYEQIAMGTPITAGQGLKAKIWADIQKTDNEESQGDAPIVAMNDGRSDAPVPNRINWARAAGIAAIVGLSAFAYIQVQQNNELDDRIADLEQRVESSDQEIELKGSLLAELENDLTIIKDPTYTQITLAGTENSPASLAKVYWNASMNEVYLSVNRMEELPAGKVYQLWALDDGVPVDAGTFTPQDSLIRMKAISAGQAFAVTIEDEGGAESPALETLQVIGSVPA